MPLELILVTSDPRSLVPSSASSSGSPLNLETETRNAMVMNTSYGPRSKTPMSQQSFLGLPTHLSPTTLASDPRPPGPSSEPSLRSPLDFESEYRNAMVMNNHFGHRSKTQMSQQSLLDK